jgi:hypothetical protein
MSNKFKIGLMAVAVAMGMASCDDSKSYAELLTDEAHAINAFLANQNVILEPPADGSFITGEDAPYYRMDEEGNVYMQVIDMGDTSQMAKSNELIYFRFTRYSLNYYDADADELTDGWGNADDLSVGSASFRFGSYSDSDSEEWGSGLQLPLSYIGLGGQVNLVIRSQYGLNSEIANVIPYVYNVRYYRAGASNYGDEETAE